MNCYKILCGEVKVMLSCYMYLSHNHTPTHPPMQCEEMMEELKAQLELAKEYKANLDDVKRLHSSCNDEANRMRSDLISKETQLARMLTALQVTSKQVKVHAIYQ